MFRNPDSRTVLIIPALDEEDAIGVTLDRLPAGLYREVLVIDNGSRDRTAEVARSRGATVIREPERGYGAACLRGIAAIPPGSEIVVFMDGDASDDPHEALYLVEPISSGRADLVIGSRTLGRSQPGALLPHQVFGNRLTALLLRLFYGRRFTDLGPFRAIRADTLGALGMQDRNFGWTVEMQIRAVRRGLRIVEVPVSYNRRIGTSKISGNLSASLRAGAKIIWTVFRLALR